MESKQGWEGVTISLDVLHISLKSLIQYLYQMCSVPVSL